MRCAALRCAVLRCYCAALSCPHPRALCRTTLLTAGACPSPPLFAGQTKPTRVVRLLAQDSVEKQVLEVRRLLFFIGCLLTF